MNVQVYAYTDNFKWRTSRLQGKFEERNHAQEYTCINKLTCISGFKDSSNI